MKLFQQLLVAPAALGLVAPLAVSAGELNINGVNQYASDSQEQVTSISQFSDVRPTDWAYQALSNLIERYGCVAGYPNGTFRGGQAMTRYEAAALLNACLDRISEVTDELKKLMAEFEKELAVLRGRVDGLEAKVGELEANQFSTTTKLKGIATFVLGANSFGGSVGREARKAERTEGATTFNYDVRLNLDTSFTGKDLLRTTLRAGNFADSAFGNGGLNTLEAAFEEGCGAADCGDVVAINRLFYQFPIGDGFTATFGGRVRQDDMLAMWPSAYPADTVLDVFTYAGAPGAYNLNLGAGAGIWYKKDGWNLSLNYVSANADAASPANRKACYSDTDGDNKVDTLNGTCGGIGTDAAQQTFTAQLGYAGSNYGLAVAYNYANGVGPATGTPDALSYAGRFRRGSFANTFPSNNSIGISGYWQPSESGWMPSVSAGWGFTSFNHDDDLVAFDSNVQAQSWYVGLQWADAFIKGNTLGMAVGQPTFITDDGIDNTTVYDGNYAWEWWYKFQVTDNISVTPAIFYLSNPLGADGNAAREAAGKSGAALTNFGGVIKTTFKF